MHLIVTEAVHIPVWGTYFTTPEINAQFAKVKLRTKVATPGNAFQPLRLETEIRDAAGQVVATAATPLTATDGQEFEQNLVVPQPKLWSPETPVLYTASSKLYAGSALKDAYTTRFGIRSFMFAAGKGFVLNGQPRKFKSVCNHHDLGPLGTAVNTAACATS